MSSPDHGATLHAAEPQFNSKIKRDAPVSNPTEQNLVKG
jgi:hypothetical protein